MTIIGCHESNGYDQVHLSSESSLSDNKTRRRAPPAGPWQAAAGPWGLATATELPGKPRPSNRAGRVK